MSAYATATTNEDHEIVPEITGTRMDPVEYAVRLARVKLDAKLVDALSELGGCLDEAVVRIHPQPLPKCDVCGADARWTGVTFITHYSLTLCDDCHTTGIDKYESFNRIVS